MSYSDYGGFAYKDGELRLDHCDVQIYKENSPFPSEKRWPLFFGDNRDVRFPNAHVSLGDQNMRVMLYKQSWFEIWLDGKEVNWRDAITAETKERVPEYETDYTNDDGVPYFNSDAFAHKEAIAVFEVGGYRVEIAPVETGNYYILARLTQPDGHIWTGFSGYCVGNGHGDSREQVELLRYTFPAPKES